MFELMASFPREHRITGVIFDYPSLMLAVIVSYVAFVVSVGPAVMRHRTAFNVRAVTRVYNLLQVAANLWYIYNVVKILWKYGDTRFTLLCNPPSTMQESLAGAGDTEWLIKISIIYFYVRVADFLDTVFFVLARKFSHISFLHVYHHVIVVVTSYVYLRSGWGPAILILSIINAAIHSLMYSYYFLSTFEALRPFLWWKRYLTAMQIAQFLFMGAQMVSFVVKNCGYPPIVLHYNVTQICIFLALFARFYLINYGSSSSHHKPQLASKQHRHKQ